MNYEELGAIAMTKQSDGKWQYKAGNASGQVLLENTNLDDPAACLEQIYSEALSQVTPGEQEKERKGSQSPRQRRARRKAGK